MNDAGMYDVLLEIARKAADDPPIQAGPCSGRIYYQDHRRGPLCPFRVSYPAVGVRGDHRKGAQAEDRGAPARSTGHPFATPTRRQPRQAASMSPPSSSYCLATGGPR